MSPFVKCGNCWADVLPEHTVDGLCPACHERAKRTREMERAQRADYWRRVEAAATRFWAGGIAMTLESAIDQAAALIDEIDRRREAEEGGG